jgi:hypothetical protein
MGLSTPVTTVIGVDANDEYRARLSGSGIAGGAGQAGPRAVSELDLKKLGRVIAMVGSSHEGDLTALRVAAPMWTASGVFASTSNSCTARPVIACHWCALSCVRTWRNLPWIDRGPLPGASSSLSRRIINRLDQLIVVSRCRHDVGAGSGSTIANRRSVEILGSAASIARLKRWG